MDATGRMRAVRACVFAAACLGVSAAGHVWMSGRPVPAGALLLGFALVFAVALAVAGRRRGLLSISALMLAGEAGLHLLFSLGQVGSGAASMPGMAMPGMAAPGMPDMPGMSMASTSVGVMPMSTVAGHGTAGMIAVHLAAGLASAWWLHRGERAFFGLLSWMRGKAADLLPCAALHAAPQPVVGRLEPHPVTGSRAPARHEPLTHVLVRRGPPQSRLAG
jgi:hypothetical protein